MNNKDKIYIAGCGGMLGEAFYKVFEKNYHLKCTDISVNEKFSFENLTAKRPGYGLPSIEIKKLIKKKSDRNYKPDDLIK